MWGYGSTAAAVGRRQKAVAFKEDYYPWDRRPERVQCIRSGKRKHLLDRSKGRSASLGTNPGTVSRFTGSPTRVEAGLDLGDPWAIWGTGQSALVDEKVHG